MHPMQFVLFTVKTVCMCCACDCVSVCPLSLCVSLLFTCATERVQQQRFIGKDDREKHIYDSNSFQLLSGKVKDSFLIRMPISVNIFFHSFISNMSWTTISIHIYINFIMQRMMQLNLAQCIHVDSTQFHIHNATELKCCRKICQIVTVINSSSTNTNLIPYYL